MVIERLIYGFHPYGMPGAGTAESLQSLTREDFVDFHRRFFVPNNALVAVVGDISSADAMAGLEKYFGDWKPGDLPPFAPIAPPEPTKRVIVIDQERTRCRPRSASATSRFRASTTTTRRSIRR